MIRAPPPMETPRLRVRREGGTHHPVFFGFPIAVLVPPRMLRFYGRTSLLVHRTLLYG